jgi:hypothetical protein
LHFSLQKRFLEAFDILFQFLVRFYRWDLVVYLINCRTELRMSLQLLVVVAAGGVSVGEIGGEIDDGLAALSSDPFLLLLLGEGKGWVVIAALVLTLVETLFLVRCGQKTYVVFEGGMQEGAVDGAVRAWEVARLLGRNGLEGERVELHDQSVELGFPGEKLFEVRKMQMDVVIPLLRRFGYDLHLQCGGQVRFS